MAVSKIRGNKQIIDGTILNAQIGAAAAIATTKLADGANFIQRGGSVAFTADQSMGGFKLTNLAAPVSANDAARKADVDAAQTGLDVKQSVRVATTAALPTVTAAGASIGKTPPASAVVVLTIDGIATVLNDRILVKNQVAGADNGLYKVTTEGTASVAFILTRTTDADENAEVTGGMFTFIEEGTSNTDTGWVCTNNGAITVDTTALAFSQFTGVGDLIAGAGLTKTGNTIDVVSANGGIVVNANDIALTVADASLDIVAGGIKIAAGTAGQVVLANASGIPIAQTLSGDVASVSGAGAVTLASTVLKQSSVVTRETPSGAIDDSNQTFTLANTPVAGSESVYLNGLLGEPGAGNDYTISGATITYLDAPESGDKLRVSYLK